MALIFNPSTVQYIKDKNIKNILANTFFCFLPPQEYFALINMDFTEDANPKISRRFSERPDALPTILWPVCPYMAGDVPFHELLTHVFTPAESELVRISSYQFDPITKSSRNVLIFDASFPYAKYFLQHLSCRILNSYLLTWMETEHLCPPELIFDRTHRLARVQEVEAAIELLNRNKASAASTYLDRDDWMLIQDRDLELPKLDGLIKAHADTEMYASFSTDVHETMSRYEFVDAVLAGDTDRLMIEAGSLSTLTTPPTRKRAASPESDSPEPGLSADRSVTASRSASRSESRSGRRETKRQRLLDEPATPTTDGARTPGAIHSPGDTHTPGGNTTSVGARRGLSGECVRPKLIEPLDLTDLCIEPPKAHESKAQGWTQAKGEEAPPRHFPPIRV